MPPAALGWFFRNCTSGYIVIGQSPNTPLLASWIVLAVWAGDELLRGVAP